MDREAASMERLGRIKELATQLELCNPEARLSKPLVLFGAGPLGQMVITHLSNLGIAPIAVADNNKSRWGGSVGNVPIISPQEAISRHARAARFVVTIYNGSKIRQHLRDQGCTAVSHFAELYFEHPTEFLPYCGLAPRSAILEHWPAVVEAAYFWQDERSTNEYLAQLAWRLRLENVVMPPPDSPSDCYFPKDLFTYSSNEVLVDCGAFDGDSINAFLSRRPTGSNAQIVALEPDERSFEKLSNYSIDISANPRIQVRTIRAAVGDEPGELRFAAMGSVRSSVDHYGQIKVSCVRIDDLGVIPTLIKMDVEGFELQALKGAAACLQFHQPVLAISMYHRPADLWAISSYIRKLVPDYRLFLRRYAEDCWELVLYAVPVNRCIAGVN